MVSTALLRRGSKQKAETRHLSFTYRLDFGPSDCYTIPIRSLTKSMTGTRMVQDTLSSRLANIRDRIGSAAKNSNRLPGDIRLIAITKTPSTLSY
jgi:hypothetical protein